MKLLLTSFVAFMAVTFTSSAEINPEEHKSNKECKTIALEGDYYENGGEEEIEKPNEGSPCQGTESSQCPVQTQGRIAPVSSLPQQPGLDILENIPVAPNYIYGLTPFQRNFNWNGQWQRIVNVPELNSAPSSAIQYYAHPPLFAAYGHSSMYLPPALPTYARRSIPELHSQIYRRPARVIRSREEDDIMAELQHMAMMNNILPTMPIPFLRSSSYGNGPYEASRLGGATVVYPASVSNCALPLLLSCAPKITRGNLAKPLPVGNIQPQWSNLAKQGLKQTLNKEFVIEDKSDSSQIHGSSNESVDLADHGNYLKGPIMNAIDRALRAKHVGDNDVITDKKRIEATLPAAHTTS